MSDNADVEQDKPRPQPEAMVSFQDLFAAQIAAAQERQRTVDEHRATGCIAVPCDRCERYPCRRCKRAATDYDGMCPTCELDERLSAARRSIPKRFRWALGADREKLLATAPKLTGIAVDSGLSWARSFSTTSLVLRGDPGAGKTSLATALFGVWLLTHRDPTARFVESFALAQARARHHLGQGEAPAVDEAMRAGLLVIDDMGSEDALRSGVVGEVLLSRHNDELPTWVTTFLSPDEMAKRYGAGVTRRVFEGAKSVRVG